MPNYQVTIPKITWQRGSSFTTEGFETYSNVPGEPRWWGNWYTPMSEGPGGAFGSGGIEIFALSVAGAGSAFEPTAVYSGFQGMELLSNENINLNDRSIFLRRVFGGFTPGQSVVVQIQSGVGFNTRNINSIIPHGLRVNGVVDASTTTGVWVQRSVAAVADGSGNLTVDFGLFDLYSGNPGTPQSLVFFDALSLPAGPDLGTLTALEFGMPMQQIRTWPEPSGQSQEILYESGFRDAWVEGYEQLLEGTLLSIPSTDELLSSFQKPWSGYNPSWHDFLLWAREGGTFQFYPDREDPLTFKTCYLVEPYRGALAKQWAETRTFTLRLKTADGSRWVGY